MNDQSSTSPNLNWALAALGALSLGYSALAFPPAPTHTFYGMVRNEMGDPIMLTNAVVILETLTGTQVKTTVVPYLASGMNYRLGVPMDAGLTADAYQPTALQPTVAFRIKVIIGTTTYLPMELHGSYANLGKPAESTHLDLTLGEDSDNDGLPDAWERALIAMLGRNLTLQDLKPGDDADGDGLTNLQEYLTGTYAFDPADGMRLEVDGMSGGYPILKFMAIRSRTYSVLASSNLKSWAPVAFRIMDTTASNDVLSSYCATDVRILRVAAIVPETGSAQAWSFKLMAQ
jgi:hypothetical protein